MAKRGHTDKYPQTRRGRRLDPVAVFADFCARHVGKIVRLDTLPTSMHEMLAHERAHCRQAAKKSGVALLTHRECPALLKNEQILFWPDDMPLPAERRAIMSVKTVRPCRPASIARTADGGAIDQRRRQLSSATESETKSRLGQFLTPYATARFMASLFDIHDGREYRLLDPGAGIGSLTAAFLERLQPGADGVSVTACEIDTRLHGDLSRTLSKDKAEIIAPDFIETAVNWLQFEPARRFTHAIINPPYKKIASSSSTRRLIRNVGIETVNLYSAFVALSLLLLEDGGQLVAIIPRSFCNGPYYKPFRKLILAESAITHIHLFGSRTSAFKDDKVLQENVIIMLVKGAAQGEVAISSSTDDSFTDYGIRTHAFDQIVTPDDKELFINIPTTEAQNHLGTLPGACCSLRELGVSVSTGPVVDFRVKGHLRRQVEPGTVPLLYPSHCVMNGCVWPKPNGKKPNALSIDEQTRKALFPLGYYCVVKRFSSKEEQRRISASVITPEAFKHADALAFENHLNVFHESKAGIPHALAFGLSVYLNTSFVDNVFRRFNGHTQVNATDLRQLRYPSRDTLVQIGKWAMQQQDLTQARMNDHVIVALDKESASLCLKRGA